MLVIKIKNRLSCLTESLTGMRWALAAALIVTIAIAGAARAQDLRTEDTLSLPLFKSGILNLDKRPSQISVGNPGIADILILKGTQVHVIAKALGSTNVVFWDGNGSIFATVDIEVTHDLDSLKQKLHILLPNEDIGVHSAQEKIILRGTVTSASNLQAAMDIADSYLPECIEAKSSATDTVGRRASSDGASTNSEGCKKATVVNLMTVGGAQQVLLEVKIAEISRTFLRTMDTDLSVLDLNNGTVAGAVNGGGTWPNLTVGGQEVLLAPFGNTSGQSGPVGPVVDVFQPTAPSITNTGVFFSRLMGSNYFQLAMEISRSKGLSKILAEPNLTTLTGRPAKFVSGGEFPIAVTTDNGVEVTYKEYGVIVDFLPTILDDQRINLDLEIGVSDIRLSNLIGGFPLIDKRGASSTVELKNGQTIGIAGLIQDDMTESFSRLPGLGDIPILGALFRSQDYMSGQTELVMFVTPHLAKPISPDLIKLPTDSFVPPSDLEFYLLGTMASLKEPEVKSHRKTLDGGFDGVTFGHKL